MILNIICIILIIILICTILFLYKIAKAFKFAHENDNAIIEELKKNSYDYKKELERYKEQCKIYEDEIKEFPEIEINGRFKKKSMKYQGFKVLIGDYMPDISLTTMKALQYYGIDVDVVRSSHDIIERIKNGYDYDLIFTNNVFPCGESGEDTLYQLKLIENFDKPIIIHSVSENKRNYFINECGFDEYIVKPVTIEKLKPILEKFLEEKRKNGRKKYKRKNDANK